MFKWMIPAGILILSGCAAAGDKSTPRVYTVEIKEMKFQPAELTLQKGDTVVFINNDMLMHDVTELKNKVWSSGQLAHGQSFKLVVKDGVDYYCSLHVVMKGKLMVR